MIAFFLHLTENVIIYEFLGWKRARKGDRADQEARGNNYSMLERCRRQNIHFWPVAIENDGCATGSFLAFFNNVCNAAKDLTDQNPSAFKNYWRTRIACEIHQCNARLTLQRSAQLRRTLSRIPTTANDILQVLEPQMDLPSTVSSRSGFRDHQRRSAAFMEACRRRARRRV